MTSEASEKRGGGSVKCCVTARSLALQRFALAHGGQAAAVLVVAVVVAAFLIQREEAIEFHHLAGGAQFEHARACLRGDIDRRALQFGGFHLAGDGADPDQLIEPRLIVIETPAHLGGTARQVGRPDRFMRFLRVLGLGLILARRIGNIGVAVVLTDHLARLHDRRIVDLHAVGPHIGNETGGLAADVDAFIEALRDPHGMRGRKAHLAAGFLLQRRCRERRLRIAARRLGFDGRDREVGGLDRFLEILGFRAGADIEPLDFLAVGTDETRFEGVAARRGQRRHQRPVFARNEFFDFEFAVAYEPQRDRLHPACRARARQFSPQHRRKRKADQIIQRAAREIGVDQRAVDLARVLHRLGHRLLGDGVENHALDRLILERAFLLHDFEDMPGNRFAFAVGVGCENQFVGALERAGDVIEPAGRLGIDLPDHLEIGIGIDRSVLGREVADVAERGQNFVGGPDIC